MSRRVVVLFVVLLSVFGVQQARATCAEVTAYLAGPNCQWDGVAWTIRECRAVASSNPGMTIVQARTHTQNNPTWGDWSNQISFTCNLCEAMAGFKADKSDGSVTCVGGCVFAPDGDGAIDTVRSGSWLAQLAALNYMPTGEHCPPETPDNPPPPVPPNLCGGSSCVEAGGTPFCAKASDGSSVCVPRPPPGGPGQCASKGDTTLCAGSPPPLPPNPPIADPATDIAGTDTFGHQEGNGAVTNTTVNNFNNSGAAPANGGAAGDAGNAPGSPNAPPGSPNGPPKGPGEKDDGGYAGGGDCNTPPVCSGDKPTCGVVDQVWLSRCKGPAKAGTSAQPEWTKVSDGDRAAYDDVPAAEPGHMTEVTVDASMIETTGWVGNSCPALPQAGPLHLDEYQDFWCNWLSKIRAVFLLFGAFVAVKIIAGGRG